MKRSLIRVFFGGALCLLMMPLQGMLSRASSKVTRKNPVKSSSSVHYQKSAATQKFLKQRAQIHQQGELKKTPGVSIVEPIQQKNEPSKQGLMVPPKMIDDKRQKFNFERSSVPSKGSLGALLAALGLGWLWSTSDDEDKEKDKGLAQHK